MPDLTAPAPMRSIVVEIGGTPIQLSARDSDFLEALQNRYEGFLTSASRPSIDLSIDLVPPGDVSDQIGGQFSRRFSQGDVSVVRDARRWRAQRSDFLLHWDAESGSGHVRQSANPYSLDGILRILHTLTLAGQGGFLLHGASAIRNGRAFVFFGPSGAGKTTMMRLAPADATLLTDEISYIRGDGENYRAFGTPFTGELAKSGENVSAPVAALYRLAHAPENRLTLMTPGDAVRALLESVLFFAEDPDLVKLVFQSACDVVSRLPVYQLEFVPDTGVWESIR